MKELDKTRDDFGRACKQLEEVLDGKRPAAEARAALKTIDKHIKTINAENRRKRAELKKQGVKVPTSPGALLRALLREGS
jgi:hypothetical protein